MTTIRVVPEMDLNKDGKVSLGELIASTFMLGIMLTTGALFITGAIWIIFLDTPAWLKIVCGIVTLGILVSVGFGIWRMLRYERGEKLAQKDWEHEYKRKNLELDHIMGVTNEEGSRAWTKAEQDRYAQIYLEMSYRQGKFVTRAEWKKIGLPEDAWNKINVLMQKYYIRRGGSRTLPEDTDYAWAWGEWVESTRRSKSWSWNGEELIPQ